MYITKLFLFSAFAVASGISESLRACPLKADVHFAMDKSGSLQANVPSGEDRSTYNFKLLVNFVRNVTKTFQINEDGVHVSFSSYSNKGSSMVKQPFKSGTAKWSSNQTSVNNFLSNYSEIVDGSTNPAYMLVNKIKPIFSNRARAVPKVIIFLTDGKQTVTDLDYPYKKIGDWCAVTRAEGFTIFAVGIAEFNKTELISMTGDENKVFTVAGFDKLNSVMQNMSDTLCRTCPKTSEWDESKFKCVDIDECKIDTHNCTSTQYCSNIEDGFTCKNCDITSIENCLTVKPNCDNTGKKTCEVCKDGYALSSGNTTCLDIDECATNTHNCDSNLQYCNNIKGKFECNNCDPTNIQNCINFKPGCDSTGKKTCEACEAGYTLRVSNTTCVATTPPGRGGSQFDANRGLDGDKGKDKANIWAIVGGSAGGFALVGGCSFIAYKVYIAK
eukprot:Pgem_evm1s488